MNQRKHLTLVAAGAALLGALPLATVFARWTWLIDAFLIVAALCGTALLVRSLRAPSWVPTVAMGGVGLIVLTWLFPSGSEIFGIIPSTATFTHFNDLLRTAGTEMSEFSVPVDDRVGFLFLTTLGVGGVAVVIDLFAVVLRRPALAGLPMLAIYSVPVAVEDGSVNLIPFALGAAGFLWLLVTDNVDRVRRFGRRFTGDGRDVDLWEPSPLAAAGQRLGLIGIVIAIMLPLAVPGMTTGLLARFGRGNGVGVTGGGVSGRSVSFSAVLSGELTRDHPIEMLKVTNVNDPSPFYLRFGVADELRTDGFFNRPLAPGQPVNSGIPTPTYGPDVITKAYKANVEVLNLEIAYLPTYTNTTKVDKFDNSWVFDRGTSTIFSGKETTKKKKYTIEYSKPEFSPNQLKTAQPLRNDDPIQRTFTVAPPIAYVKDLVQKLTAGKPTQYDKVKSIFDYFSTSNGFVYDLSTGPETSGPKIVDFLQNKRGYCVQYAAAMGWLLREAKIPSRVAFGFTRGGAKQGNTLTLTNFNLHAWTEVYFQGYGWLPFDATPASAIGGSVSPAWAPNPSQPITSSPNDGNDTLKPGQPTGPGASAAPTNPAVGPNASNSGGGGHTGLLGLLFGIGAFLTTTSALMLILVLLVALVAALPALSRLATRRKRLRFSNRPVLAMSLAGAPGAQPGPSGPAGATGQADAAGQPGAMADLPPGEPIVLPPDDAAYIAARGDAHHAWDELIDTMTDYRVAIHEAETPRATGSRLVARERLRDDAEAGVRLLSSAEEHARYALRPITGTELRSSLTAVRGAISTRADRRTRIVAVLMPPSVTQRWRLAISRNVADFTNGLGRRRDSLVRALSVRRLVTRRTSR
jgi:transglutaminase-like putative cysteine protease